MAAAGEHVDGLEPRWPASLAVLLVILLSATLPDKFTVGPPWVFPALEGAILVPLSVTAPHRLVSESMRRRAASIVLIAVVNVANMASLALLVRVIVRGGHLTGHELIFSAAQIWLTNVLLFGPWRPGFIDYLYVSFTNATAFSPTDTMPLSPWAKMLMLVQSLAALITVAIVAARAVNIIS